MYGVLLLCDVNDSGEKRQLNYIKMRDGVTTTYNDDKKISNMKNSKGNKLNNKKE